MHRVFGESDPGPVPGLLATCRSPHQSSSPHPPSSLILAHELLHLAAMELPRFFPSAKQSQVTLVAQVRPKRSFVFRVATFGGYIKLFGLSGYHPWARSLPPQALSAYCHCIRHEDNQELVRSSTRVPLSTVLPPMQKVVQALRPRTGLLLHQLLAHGILVGNE